MRQLKRHKILIADSDLEAAEHLKAILNEEGFQVRIAIDGVSAMEVLDGFTPDLALIDIHLSEMSGFEVCEAMQQDPRLDNTLCVAQANRQNPELCAQAQFAGFGLFIFKPVDAAMLKVLLAPCDYPSQAESGNVINFAVTGTSWH